MTPDSIIYIEWLTTIANTRLIYNTMSELEDMLDSHSIHNNGIKRCFASLQRLRSAFRDLKVEVELMTDGAVALDSLLQRYSAAWTFFRKHLYRRAHPERVALELLAYCYLPDTREAVVTKRAALYRQAMEEEISLPFLVLLLMKALPGYDSKEGDVEDMASHFERVLSLLTEFTEGRGMISLLPTINKAREETWKTRLMLLYHVEQILNTYMAYMNNAQLYDTSSLLKESRCRLDIVGFWNESQGKPHSTQFWQIEEALEDGTYFMTHWRKDAANRLTGIRYALFIMEETDDKLIYYLIHPLAIQQRMKGRDYGDADQVWYQTERMEECPSALPLQRLLPSRQWPLKIQLTRCQDADVVALYQRWLHHDCEVVKPYAHLEYEFHPNIYAITQSHIYISSENEGEYYKVPKSAYEGFERIQISDNVGTMLMNGKVYLAFDEFMLYVGTSPKELQHYGIERVNCID